MNRRMKWRRMVLIVAAALLLIGVLAGCRSRSREAPAEEAPAAEVAPESPTEAPAEAAAQPEAQEAAAEEAAEEPAAEEAPAAPADEGQAAAQGACDHPYYPIRDGAVYNYQMTAPDMEPTEMTISYRVTGPNSFVATQTLSGMTTEMGWLCTDGGLLRTDFRLGGVDIPGVEYSIDGVTGITYPQADQMVEGATWQNVFTMSGEMSTEELSMSMNIEATTDNVLTGFEQVTTPAGTFDAAKVESTTTIEMSTDMGAMPAMPGMEMRTTVWLAEGVGMVRTESIDPTGGTTVMELTALE